MSEVSMNIKDALLYVISEMCCSETAELCEHYCPLRDREGGCEGYSFVDKKQYEEVIKTLRKYYDSL